MINDRGGVNGRKVTLIALDDGYSPPKMVEQTRKLVEQEEAASIRRSKSLRQSGLTQNCIGGVAARNAQGDRKIPPGNRAVPDFMAALALPHQGAARGA